MSAESTNLIRCPKCSGRLIPDGDDMSRCLNCGKYVPMEMPVIAPIELIKPREPQGKKVYQWSETDRVVWSFRDSVAKLQKEGAHITSIVRLIMAAKKIRSTEKSALMSVQRLISGRLEAAIGSQNI